jgi:acyl-CoA synthetase (NDP forming)
VIPSYAFPESAARALAKAAEHGAWAAKPEGPGQSGPPAVDHLDPEAADDSGLVLEQLLQLGTGIG